MTQSGRPLVIPPTLREYLGEVIRMRWTSKATDGRVALKVLEDDRMSGPSHYRAWDDGTREQLPTELSGYSVPTGSPPEEVERAQEGYYAHNRADQEHLRQRGFLAPGSP